MLGDVDKLNDELDEDGAMGGGGAAFKPKIVAFFVW